MEPKERVGVIIGSFLFDLVSCKREALIIFQPGLLEVDAVGGFVIQTNFKKPPFF
jgi:hypothetical protein